MPVVWVERYLLNLTSVPVVWVERYLLNLTSVPVVWVERYLLNLTSGLIWVGSGVWCDLGNCTVCGF